MRHEEVLPVLSDRSICQRAVPLCNRAIRLGLFQILQRLVLQVLQQIAWLQRYGIDGAGQCQDRRREAGKMHLAVQSRQSEMELTVQKLAGGPLFYVRPFLPCLLFYALTTAEIPLISLCSGGLDRGVRLC
jgi:hypothetical protein